MAQLYLPGACLAAAVNSLNVANGASVFTPTARMVLDTRATGTMSLGSYESLLYMNGCTVKLPAGANKNVWSSFALKNAVIATMLSPPGRFSTTTGCPHSACNLSAKSRAPMSAPAPGPNGTMNFTGRCGHAPARTASGAASTTAPIKPHDKNARRVLSMKRLRLCPLDGHHYYWSSLQPLYSARQVAFLCVHTMDIM